MIKLITFLLKLLVHHLKTSFSRLDYASLCFLADGQLDCDIIFLGYELNSTIDLIKMASTPTEPIKNKGGLSLSNWLVTSGKFFFEIGWKFGQKKYIQLLSSNKFICSLQLVWGTYVNWNDLKSNFPMAPFLLVHKKQRARTRANIRCGAICTFAATEQKSIADGGDKIRCKKFSNFLF